MSELPPMKDVLDALRYAVAPSAGATFAYAVFIGGIAWAISKASKYDWRRFTPAIAVFAVAAGMAAGNHFREVFPWVPDGKPWHWAWWALGLAAIVEMLARFPGVQPTAGNLLRGAAAGVIAAFVVPASVQNDARWWIPAFGFASAIQWAIVDAVGRRTPGGWLPAALAVVSGGAAAILIHAESAGFTDMASCLLTGLGVIAVLAWLTRCDGNSAASFASFTICVLLLLGRHLRDSEVTDTSFLLVAFAPLVLGLFVLPGISRINSHWSGGVLKAIVVAVPVGIAVYRVVHEAPLTFGEKW